MKNRMRTQTEPGIRRPAEIIQFIAGGKGIIVSADNLTGARSHS